MKNTLQCGDAPVISVDLMRRSDAAAIAAGTPSKELMLRAAKGILHAVSWRPPVAILAGGGNNGGDGCAVAMLMRELGMSPTLFLLSDRLSPDGRHYLDRARALGADVRRWQGDDLLGYATILDALLGTGFTGAVREPFASAIRAANASGAYIVSADIPSGLNGDTGEAELAVRADLTVSIGYYKQGLFLARGREFTGRAVNVDIGIPLLAE